MSNLIAVSKGADYLEIHPNGLEEHRRLGWAECPPRKAEETEDGGKKLTVAELRAALTERGIDFDPAAKKADLQALLDAETDE